MLFEQTQHLLRIVVPALGIDLKGPGPFTRVRTQDSEQTFQNGVLHGFSRWFTPDGQLLSEHWFWKGKRVGMGCEYYASGRLYRREFFRDGLKEGKQLAYYEDGQLKTEESYQADRLHGEVCLYWPGGQLKRKAQFDQGVRLSEQMWDERGFPTQ